MHFYPVLLLLGTVAAVNMKYYEAETGVADGFEVFLETFIKVLENPDSGTNYTNYFTEDAHLKILDPPIYDVTGLKKIEALWAGSQVNLTWDHYPNTTSIQSTTSSNQTIKMNGKVETHWDIAGNCSTSYITWLLTLRKVDGTIDLTPQDKNYEVFWDYLVFPYQPHTPTNIPCTG